MRTGEIDQRELQADLLAIQNKYKLSGLIVICVDDERFKLFTLCDEGMPARTMAFMLRDSANTVMGSAEFTERVPHGGSC